MLNNLQCSIKPTHLTKPDKTNGESTEYSTNGSTGQLEKAPAEPVCLITFKTSGGGVSS